MGSNMGVGKFSEKFRKINFPKFFGKFGLLVGSFWEDQPDPPILGVKWVIFDPFWVKKYHF